MSSHTGQPSSKSDRHSEELQLVVLAQQNNRLMFEVLHFRVTQYQNQDELNILLNTAKQLKYHYFALEQQSLLNLPDKASHISRTAFLSYLIDN